MTLKVVSKQEIELSGMLAMINDIILCRVSTQHYSPPKVYPFPKGAVRMAFKLRLNMCSISTRAQQLGSNSTSTMPWFYTDISIIAPPKRFIVPNHKLRFEIALLEFHAWFTAGDNERGKLEAMEITMFQYLTNGQNSSPPQDFTQWLCNVYTGMAPFNKVTLADIEMYHEGVSMNGENTLSLAGHLCVQQSSQTGDGGLLVLVENG